MSYLTTWWGRTLIAFCGGLLMFVAFSPRDLWPFALTSLMMLFLGLAGVEKKRHGFIISSGWGAGLFLPLLTWVGEFVGAGPWVALALVIAAYSGLIGLFSVVLNQFRESWWWFAPIVVTVEALRSAFPFGGFPWGRVAFSQIGSPYLNLASLGGAPLVSFGVCLTASGLAATLLNFRTLKNITAVKLLTPALIISFFVPLLGFALQPSVTERNSANSYLTVAAIQGNVPRLGLDFNAQRRAVLDNHVRETQVLAADVQAGKVPKPDLVFWPENASDIDPFANSDAAESISLAAKEIGVPILVGTVLQNNNRPSNTILVWNPLNGPQARYDKQIIQPFGEYLPWRSFFRLFSTYADRAGNFKPGNSNGTVHVSANDHPIIVGIATCWEVAFDRGPREGANNGAQLLFVPTNNATFGKTEMSYQQLAMSQLRAIEHGKAVVIAATSGVSAIVDPNGTIKEKTGIFTADYLVNRIPLHTAPTIATRIGPLPQLLAVIAVIGGFLAIGISRAGISGSRRRSTVVAPVKL